MPRLVAQSGARLIAVAIIGLAAAGISGALGAWVYAPLIGWDATAASFSVGVWATVSHLNADETKAFAHREDPNRATTDLLLLCASVASLIGVGVVLLAASSSHGSAKGLLAGLAAASVALSWILLNTLFTLRYARLYYAAGDGVGFNQDEPPRYADFAYLAFTIGMTYQVSDTNLMTTVIRSNVLRHALLSYLFGAVILATTLNFIVSLK